MRNYEHSQSSPTQTSRKLNLRTPGDDDTNRGIGTTCDAEHCKVPDMVVRGHCDEETTWNVVQQLNRSVHVK